MNQIDVPDVGPDASGEHSAKLKEQVAFAIDLLQSAFQERDRVTSEPDDAETALNLYGLALEQIADPAANEGQHGLADVCRQLAEMVAELAGTRRALAPDELALLEEWAGRLISYFTEDDLSGLQYLADSLEGFRWKAAESTSRADSLTGLGSSSNAAISESDGSTSSYGSAADFASATIVDQPVLVEHQVVSTEFIELLVNELVAHKDIQEAVEAGASPDATPGTRRKSVETCVEEVQRLALASETVGLLALKDFLTTLQKRMELCSDGFTAQQNDVLKLFPGALLAYLSAPDDPSTGAGLIDLLRGDIWSQPPATAHVAALLRALSMVELSSDVSTSESRQKEAKPEDVVLTLPDDLNQELLDGLLQELPIHTGEFSAAIQRLAGGHGTLTDIDVAKRAAHTLKGAANTVGVKGIANLTHHIEDILVALTKYEQLPSANLADALVTAGDCLEAMGEAVMGTGPEPDYSVSVLQLVLDWANRIDEEGIPRDETTAIPQSRSTTEADSTQEDATGPAGGGTAQPQEPMVRVPASLIDELLRLMGETIISTGQVRERVRRLIKQNKTLQQQNLVFLQLANELEHLVDVQGAAGKLGTTRPQDDAFDPLEFEHYNEVHTVSRRLVEAATDAGALSDDAENDLDDLNELIEVQSRLHNQSQNTVMRTRMVPVVTVASRLQRSVRQAARLLDKRVSLSVTGAETMVDSNILNDLVDPLMHVLRNAVDHGIEMPAVRSALGKPAEGRIHLAFLREGNQLVVRCHDDGGGLNLSEIRRTAETRGLLSTLNAATDDELARLILAPGFSTRAESTQVSGRGIGMDIVYSRVLQLKGALNLRNAPGKGLEIEFRLPATLLSTHALLVRARDKVLAISSYGVQDIHYVTSEQVQTVGGERHFRLGEEFYPLTELDALLHLPPDKRVDERSSGFPVIFVRQDSGAIRAVRVQEIIDSTELVVKGLGRYVPRPHGVMGATILGDGSVAAVVDLPELLREPVRRTTEFGDGDARSNPNDAVRARHFNALVVDDSLSARRATAQFMKDAGFEVRTAIDGLEAASMLNSWKPDILLVDMEMPRMNGLELTAHVRAQSATAAIPIIMITSRSTEKHRRQAESAGVNVYLTKPFGEEQLLRHVTELTAA